MIAGSLGVSFLHAQRDIGLYPRVWLNTSPISVYLTIEFAICPQKTNPHHPAKPHSAPLTHTFQPHTQLTTEQLKMSGT